MLVLTTQPEVIHTLQILVNIFTKGGSYPWANSLRTSAPEGY